MTPAGADILVIGGGIVGASCARALAERGARVQVLDAGLHGASAAGMGHLLVLEDHPAELAITRYSVERWHALATRLPEDCAYRRNGTLWLAANDAEMAVAERKYANLRDHGINAELIGGRSLRDHEPELAEGLAGALRLPDDGIVYAPNVVRWLLAHTRITCRRAEVTAVEGNRARLGDGRWLTADAVVLANGIQATSLCPALPITPKKGHLLITDRYPGRVRHTVTELAYVTSVHNASGSSVALNVQPRPTGQLFIGTSRQFDTTDPAVDGPLMARMLRRAVERMPGLATLNGIRAWTGFRAATPDSLPLIGACPGQDGLWLAVGHEGLGVTTATATADLLTAQLFGEAPPLPEAPYAPARYLGNAHA